MRRLSLLGAVLLVGLDDSAFGQAITEFSMPTYFSPNAITSGPGVMYFSTLDSRDRIGKITMGGTVTQFGQALTVDCGLAPLRGSDTIALGADGVIWMTPDCGFGFGEPPPVGAAIAGFDPSGLSLGQQLVASLPTALTLGPDGNMWFSGDGFGLSPMPGIWRITDGFVATRFPIPPSDQTVAMGLAVGRDGNIWFTEEGAAKIGNISVTGVVTQFDLPSLDRRPFFITDGPDGNLWFTESSADGSKSWIARVTLAGGVTEFPLTTPSSLGYARITSGPDGNVWFTEPGFDQPLGKIGRITPAGAITEFATPTANSGPTGIAAGPDGNIWFTEPSHQKIGRLSIPASCANSQTLCLNGGRFSVTADFRVTSAGPSASATAAPLSDDTGYFWFFDPLNVEVVAKVLDGCAANGHYWFFASGLTNVGVQIHVTDTLTGTVKPFSNVAGAAFPPIQDTAAFPCP